ncbi:GAF and ANTAR domain-containing protein [Nocardia sp. NPDC056064]|uniref:GAF and ANTAR domain-containing protein n=1 Tax=Nocardia sp. NPDC056064 TaxID=3345701 RepID=UPI0035DD86D4
MNDTESFIGVLSRFARLPVTKDDVNAMLTDLTDIVTVLLDLAGAGVILAVDGQLRHVTATPGPAVELERYQERFRSGPCCVAHETHETVSVTDVREHAVRWPGYSNAARRVGIAAVAAIPIAHAAERVGVLDLYAAEPRRWSGADIEAAQVLADIAGGYLVNSAVQHRQQQLTEQLQRALDARIVIEQAKGILANQHSIDMDQAFALIRNHARSHHVTVQAVAKAIVELHLRL